MNLYILAADCHLGYSKIPSPRSSLIYLSEGYSYIYMKAIKKMKYNLNANVFLH